jgi:hypothetical protein
MRRTYAPPEEINRRAGRRVLLTSGHGIPAQELVFYFAAPPPGRMLWPFHSPEDKPPAEAPVLLLDEVNNELADRSVAGPTLAAQTLHCWTRPWQVELWHSLRPVNDPAPSAVRDRAADACPLVRRSVRKSARESMLDRAHIEPPPQDETGDGLPPEVQAPCCPGWPVMKRVRCPPDILSKTGCPVQVLGPNVLDLQSPNSPKTKLRL